MYIHAKYIQLEALNLPTDHPDHLPAACASVDLGIQPLTAFKWSLFSWTGVPRRQVLFRYLHIQGPGNLQVGEGLRRRDGGRRNSVGEFCLFSQYEVGT